MSASDPAALALLWLGTPWCHGAAVRGRGCDCLGLVRGVLADLGATLPQVPPYTPASARSAALLEAGLARHLCAVPAAAPLIRGQVLVFTPRIGGAGRHLGILSASDPAPRFVHAYARHGVVESPLSRPWARRIMARFSFS